MQIDILIDGEKKTFTVSQVPMLARRKFLEIQAREEEILEERVNIPAKTRIELENEMINILVETVFNNQFTAEQLMNGVSDDYFDEKLSEAVFGKIEEKDKREEGNDQGKQ